MSSCGGRIVVNRADSCSPVNIAPGGIPGVPDRPPHEHPARQVEERQAAGLGLLAEPADDGVDVGLAPVAALAVHLAGASVAGAVWAGSDADAGQQLFQLGAWAVGGLGRVRNAHPHRQWIVCRAIAF